MLHTPAKEVEQITDEIGQLVQDMFETMDKAPGVGLAAPQIGVGLRIFVYDYEYQGQQLRGVAINPELELSELPTTAPDEDNDVEGCLSIPGERFPLSRAQKAKLTALDGAGQRYSLEVDGWMARIFQHEYDHLEGLLYADRLIEPYLGEMKEAISAENWGKPGLSWMPGVDYLEP